MNQGISVYVDENMEWIDLTAFSWWYVDWLLLSEQLPY